MNCGLKRGESLDGAFKGDGGGEEEEDEVGGRAVGAGEAESASAVPVACTATFPGSGLGGHGLDHWTDGTGTHAASPSCVDGQDRPLRHIHSIPPLSGNDRNGPFWNVLLL